MNKIILLFLLILANLACAEVYLVGASFDCSDKALRDTIYNYAIIKTTCTKPLEAQDTKKIDFKNDQTVYSYNGNHKGQATYQFDTLMSFEYSEKGKSLQEMVAKKLEEFAKLNNAKIYRGILYTILSNCDGIPGKCKQYPKTYEVLWQK
jgi:hypothetical protein